MQEHIAPLPDEAATLQWGARLAAALDRQRLAEQGFVVHLSGDLGAGKTTLVRGILRGFGHSGAVKSPSFALLEPYNSLRIPIYHFDLYRFSSPDQWFDAGFDEIIAGPGLMLLEWPEQAAGALPIPDLHLRLQPVGVPGDEPGTEDARTLAIRAGTAAGRQCLSDLSQVAPPDTARPGPSLAS